MKIVIDIPEEDYIFVKKQVADGITNPLKVCIANGVPLPKGHGDLIDRNDLIRKQFIPNQGFELIDLATLNTMPPVISADMRN